MPVKLRKPLGSVAAQSIERKARDVPLPIGLNNYIIIIFAHRPSGTHRKDLKAKSVTAGPARSQRLRQKIAGQEERALTLEDNSLGSEL